MEQFFFKVRNRTLGLVQIAIMSAIMSDPKTAYGSELTKKVSDMVGRELADAQVYVALRRMEKQGLLESLPDNATTVPTSRTRGRPRILYNLTASGKWALEDAGAYLPRRVADQRIAKGGDHGRTNESGPRLAPVVG